MSNSSDTEKNKKKKKDKENINKKFKNISIETLFPKYKTDKDFDITSLNKKIIDIDKFDSSELLKQRKERINKLKTVYKKLLGTCIHKIKLLNDRDKTDMVYSIPSSYYGYSKYNSSECLNYIEKKLRQKYFDTYIVSPTKIFVSWINLDENKKIENEIKK